MKIRKDNAAGGWVLDLGLVNGKRKRERFKTEKAAKARMKEARNDRANVGPYWLALGVHERQSIVDTLRKMDAAGVRISDLWEAYESNQIDTTSSVGLKQAITELIGAKKKANRRTKYTTSLRQTLERFMEGQELRPVNQITSSDIEEYLPTVGESPWTVATARQRLETLFSFCVSRRWCKSNPVDAIDSISIEHKGPTILSVAECKTLLKKCQETTPKLLPWLALGIFAGVRPEECDTVTWESIDLREKILVIDAASSKVRQRRIVPLSTNLIKWLRKAKKLEGALPISPTTRRRHQRTLRDAMKWEQWPQDVLRHTAASMMMARDRDASKVADALGNSPSILHRHYRELVKPKDAVEFWKVIPSK